MEEHQGHDGLSEAQLAAIVRLQALCRRALVKRRVARISTRASVLFFALAVPLTLLHRAARVGDPRAGHD